MSLAIPASARSDNIRGIVFMLAAMAVFERPDLPSWIGIAIVTAAGLYTFLREQRLARGARP